MLVRAFVFGFYKKFHFIILKTTLSFIPYHFTTHPIFQLFYFPIQYIKIIYHPNKIYNPKVIQGEREGEEINKIWSSNFTSCYNIVLYVRRYCNTIAIFFAISSVNKACLLHFDGKISQHMQYRSVNANALSVSLWLCNLF